MSRPQVIVLVMAAAGLAAGVSFVKRNRAARVAAARAACAANLARVGQGVAAYLAQSDGRWPWMSKLRSVRLHNPPWPTMPEVLGPFTPGGSRAFRCPADIRMLADDSPLLARHGRETTYYETEGTSYEWLLGETYGGKQVGRESARGRRAVGGGDADQPIIWDFEPFHGGLRQPDSFNILYADLKVRTVDHLARLADRRTE